MKKYSIKLLALISMLMTVSVANEKLIFKSSFEDGVFLSSPDRKGSSIWWQELRGSDVPGFSWPLSILGEKGSFQMIVDNDDIDEYIKNELEVVPGIEGKPTRVLHQIIKKKEHRWTQDPYSIHLNGEVFNQLYMRYALKFPQNLGDKLGEKGWLTFAEYKTYSDYRLAIYVYSDINKKLYWHVHGDNVVAGYDTTYKKFWERDNKSIAVPENEWFNVEIFWNHSIENGRVWIAINGKVIVDYQGVIQRDEKINQIMFFTNYASNPIEQWIDDIEIWSDFPCGQGKSCHN
jgi:hypothetical protein